MSVAVRNIARLISLDIQQRSKENPKVWPSVPQDVIGRSEETGIICLCNVIALIVSPNSLFDSLFSKGKATKVTKICSDIESLIPNTTPSLSQVLLSLSMYRKTGSSIWLWHIVQWSEQQSSLLPSNIEKGLITTLVFDNIDLKNKDHKGKET